MTATEDRQRKKFRWRIVVALLVAALLPVALAGFGSWIVFGNLLEQESLTLMRTLVQGHARAIEDYLAERLHLLQLAAHSQTRHELQETKVLAELLDDLNASSGRGFVDLGIIDSAGHHLAYVGPYNLAGYNYRDAAWFAEVMASGTYISDVFPGYRQVPHCIIAIKAVEDGETWLLRATINSDQLNDLVRRGVRDPRSDAYILNRDGVYQTQPRDGSVLDQSPITAAVYDRGVRETRVEEDGVTKIRVTNWILDGRWLLVVEQDLAAVRAPVDRAIANGAVVVALAVLLLVATTFLATWHLTNLIHKSDMQKEEMTRAFMRSAKLASIGELATGLAHEINNPLAIISAEQTNISDLLWEPETTPDWQKQVQESVKRCKAQVKRCANITSKMLLFGRKQELRLELTDIVPRLEETANLLERHARVRNIKISLDTAAHLPRVMVDPVEFEQVLVNLLNNAIDAMPQGGEIVIKAHPKRKSLMLDVIDQGVGIAPDRLERVFEPFYTTKPAGQGTGLGLSVCYGMVHSWGGRISADSTVGEGTTVTVELPLPQN